MENEIAEIENENEPLDGVPVSLEIPDTENARKWAKIPLRKAQILVLHKVGFTVGELSRGWGICQNTVSRIKAQYDPDGTLTLPPNVGRVIAAMKFEATALRALNGITDDKLDKSSALQLATVAGISADNARKLRESITADQTRQDVSSLASALRAHVQTTPQVDVGEDD